MKTLHVTIPFAGFYSLHEGALETELEILEEHLGAESGTLWEKVDWQATHNKVAENYTQNWLLECPIEGAKFYALDGPREYNFRTDEIFIEAPVESLKKLRRNYLGGSIAIFYKWVRNEYASRDGFVSFVENTDAWPEVWEPRHWELMLEYIQHVHFPEVEDDIMMYMRENGEYELLMKEE